LFDIEPDAKRDDLLTADQDGTDILMAPDGGVARGVLHLGDGGHGFTPFGFLGIIAHQVDGCSRPKAQALEQLVGFLAQGRRGLPPLNQEEVVEAGPVVLSVQIPIQIGDIPPPPRTGDGEDQ